MIRLMLIILQLQNRDFYSESKHDIMDSSTNLQAPSQAAYQIVSWQYNPNLLD